MGFFGNGYNEWKSKWENASNKAHEAYMKTCDLDDNGESNTEKYRAWDSEYRSWTEVKNSLKESEPDYHKKYLDNR